MKKTISLLLAMITILSCTLSFYAYAVEENEDVYEISDEVFTKEYFDSLEHVYAHDNIQTRASGLIDAVQFGIAKKDSKIYLAGFTFCIDEVVKCGFSKIVIERKLASETKWKECFTYEDLYLSKNTYKLGKTLAVNAGYQYRATATHYAKKSLLSTQTIVSNAGPISI